MRYSNDLNARSNILQAKQQIAQAKDTAATALGGIGGKNLAEDFQKLEDKVALSNARSDARLDSADTKSGKALDDKLADLNRGPSVDDRLAALKKQLDTPAQYARQAMCRACFHTRPRGTATR